MQLRYRLIIFCCIMLLATFAVAVFAPKFAIPADIVTLLICGTAWRYVAGKEEKHPI